MWLQVFFRSLKLLYLDVETSLFGCRVIINMEFWSFVERFSPFLNLPSPINAYPSLFKWTAKITPSSLAFLKTIYPSPDFVKSEVPTMIPMVMYAYNHNSNRWLVSENKFISKTKYFKIAFTDFSINNKKTIMFLLPATKYEIFSIISWLSFKLSPRDA